ncbi:MAG: hypothetical protein ACT4RN_03020 [Pseudonocardia sp.]
MTSTARRAMRATAAVTGLAALGAGFTGSAFADEAHVQRGEGFQTASVDGFDTDSVLPVDQLSGDATAALLGGASAPAASPADDITAIGQMQGFTFEMPPMDFNTAAEGNDPTGMAALGNMGSMGMEHVAVPVTGEEQFDQTGMSPMMTPVMEHALPAIVGGQQVNAADDSDQSFGSDNGLPQPVDGPANEAAAPVTGSVMPTIAMMFGSVAGSTTNDDSTSNHEFQV